MYGRWEVTLFQERLFLDQYAYAVSIDPSKQNKENYTS